MLHVHMKHYGRRSLNDSSIPSIEKAVQIYTALAMIAGHCRQGVSTRKTLILLKMIILFTEILVTNSFHFVNFFIGEANIVYSADLNDKVSIYIFE